MQQCEFCRATLPNDARFCGTCGKVVDAPPDGFTRISNAQQSNVAQTEAATRTGQSSMTPYPSPLFPPANPTSQAGLYPSSFEGSREATQRNTPTAPLIDEEEEKRRRAALLGMGLIGLDAMPHGGLVPMVQGTPQVGNVPFTQGTPQFPGSFNAAPTQVAPQVPATFQPPVQPPASISSPTLTLHHGPQGQQGQPGHGGQPGQHPPHGCAPQLIIAAIVIPLLIMASIIGLGLTIFAPSLVLSGSSSVSAGASLVIHGSHFVPGSSVTLSLDGSIPLFAAHQHASRLASGASGIESALALSERITAGQGPINVGGDGTFTVTINVNPAWSPGKHTLVATESITHRSAALAFTILAAGGTPTPTATGTLQPSPTSKASPTVSPTTTTTPTAPSAQAGLSCLNPSSISLGPITQYSTQAATSPVTLCSNGTGKVNWTASWNTSQAPWLSLSQASGQLNAPAQTQITISASAAQLAAGNFSAVVTFSSASSAVTETLNVSFAVQAGCIKASPTVLSFSGVAGVSDPASQTVSVSSCAAGGNWQASIKTTDGASWLYASPASGSLGAGASTSVKVSVSNLKTQLKAGTYTGNITFTLASGTAVVQVTLTVQAAPTLSSNTTSLVGSQNCSIIGNTYVCYVTLTNTSATTSLSWTSSVTNIPTAVIKPASNTLAPGQSERVQIDISPSDCATNASITFTGPANSVIVTWLCYLIG